MSFRGWQRQTFNSMAKKQATIAIDVRSLAQFKKTLAGVHKDVRRKAVVNALRRGGRVIVVAARKTVPVESGALKRSLTVTTRNARSKILDPYVIYGPKAGYKETVVRWGKAQDAYPGRYGHLVEFDRQNKGHTVRGTGFMRDAANSSRGRLMPEMAKVIKRTQETAARKRRSRLKA